MGYPLGGRSRSEISYSNIKNMKDVEIQPLCKLFCNSTIWIFYLSWKYLEKKKKKSVSHEIIYWKGFFFTLFPFLYVSKSRLLHAHISALLSSPTTGGHFQRGRRPGLRCLLILFFSLLVEEDAAEAGGFAVPSASAAVLLLPPWAELAALEKWYKDVS